MARFVTDSEGMTVEQRVERIEKFIEKILTIAEAHPMGKTVLKLIGL